MAMMTLELSDSMTQWLDDEAARLGCGDRAEVIRRLIGRELQRKVKIADMQRLVDEALAEPTIEMTTEEIIAGVRERAMARLRDSA